MAVTLDLTPELESRLRDEAVREGVDVNTYVTRVVLAAYQDLAQRLGRIPRLPPAESELLAEINRGYPPETWDRYRDLTGKRRDGTLTPDEHRELIGLSDDIEAAHARRLGRVAELARLRGVSLDSLMGELGIGPATLPPDW